MTTFSFILVLALAVIVSALINQVVHGVSTPLIQIAIGVAISFFGFTASNFSLDPELFLVLFIAPLLYDEARQVDKVALWSNRTVILSLAVGLVVATILVVGFMLNFLQPSIPLAAAFALGAALGPTDAVAVASLSQRASLNKRQEVLLSGESLINDASGVVSFQFAIAALTTGAFSLLDATTSFVVSFFGGIGLGLVCAAILAFFVSRVRDFGLEDTTFHVLLEVLTPFFVFLIAEEVHVSGILAVVAAGLSYSFFNRSIGPNIARMKIVSTSVWKVLAFILNGIVFVLLGVQLPYAMSDMWEERSVSNPELIALVLALSAAVIGVRMLWFLALNYIGRKQRAHKEQKNSGGSPDQVRRVMKSVRLFTKDFLVESCALALAGPKGAITLSIMFTLPYSMGAATAPFSERDFLIFLASGVILVTLLLANFVLPVLLPKKQDSSVDANIQASIDVLRGVIEDLAARQTKENRRATQAVMKQYNDRIERIKQGTGYEEEDTGLHVEALGWEREFVLAAIDEESVSAVAGYRMLRRIQQEMDLIRHERNIWWLFGVLRKRAVLIAKSVKRSIHDHRFFSACSPEDLEVREFQIRALEHVLSKLRVCLNDPGYRTEDVSALMVEIQRDLRRLRRIGRGIGTAARVEDKATEVRRLACFLELDHIQDMYEKGRISRSTAKTMRENVHLMQLDLEDKV